MSVYEDDTVVRTLLLEHLRSPDAVYTSNQLRRYRLPIDTSPFPDEHEILNYEVTPTCHFDTLCHIDTRWIVMSYWDIMTGCLWSDFWAAASERNVLCEKISVRLWCFYNEKRSMVEPFSQGDFFSSVGTTTALFSYFLLYFDSIVFGRTSKFHRNFCWQVTG